jgi:hypothetical protein
VIDAFWSPPKVNLIHVRDISVKVVGERLQEVDLSISVRGHSKDTEAIEGLLRFNKLEIKEEKGEEAELGKQGCHDDWHLQSDKK